MRQRKIKTVMIFWLLVIGLAPLVTGMLLFFGNQVNTIKNEKSDHLLSIRQLKVSQLNNWLMERNGDMHVMSGDYEIRGLENIFSQEDPGSVAVRKLQVAEELLKRNKRNYPDYEILSILDPETGIVKLSTDEELIGLNLSNRDYYRGVLENRDLYIQDIHHSEYSDIPILTMAIPVWCLSHNEHIVGILVASINMHYSFNPLLLNREGLGRTGETLIVNSEMYAVNELRWHKNAPLNLKITAEPATRAAAGESGVFVSRDYRGEKVMAAYTFIPEMNWGFVSKQDISELYSPLYRTIGVFMFILLGSIIMVLIAALFVSRFISRPVLQLTKNAGLLKTGSRPDFGLTEGPQEILVLADMLEHTTSDLNKMVDVKKSVYRLSQQVVGEKALHTLAEDLLKEMKSIFKCQILVFFRIDAEKGKLLHLASVGAEKELRRSQAIERIPGDFQAAITEGKVQYNREMGEKENLRFGTLVGEIVPRELFTIPVMDEEKVRGVICLAHLGRFPSETQEIINEFWPVLNASFSRQLVSDHLKKTSRDLQQANEKLEVQSEELREQTEELEEQTEELEEMTGELKKQNQELEIKTREAEESNRLKSEFLSNVSHELRTPLNSILALSKLLTAKKIKSLTEKQRSYLQTIERNGKGLLHLINDILDLSKIEAGKIVLSKEEVHVNQVLEYVYDSVIPLAEGKKIRLISEPGNDLPTVITDRFRLRQIIYNLVQNAIKFTEKGHVKITTEALGDAILVRIEDTGIGISEEFKPYIFEQFMQADASTTRKFEGTGLGLSIVKKLADLLEIEVDFESEAQTGSVFTLKIPVSASWDEGEANIAYPSVNSAERASIAGKQILLVEDNREAVIQLRAVLEQEQLEVVVAENGEQAIESLKTFTPDGIILDLMMPGMDGFELLNRIRGDRETSNLPVLVLTAKDLTSEDLEQLDANHVFQLIQKGDIDVKEMLDIIQEMLTGAPSEKGKRILIVDDHLDNRITLRAMLDEEYELLDAEDARSAIKLVRNKKPSLILMDMDLPGMDGKGATAVLKSNRETAHIPIICLTAGEIGISQKEMKALGFEGMLIKPVEQEDVLKMIKRILNR